MSESDSISRLYKLKCDAENTGCQITNDEEDAFKTAVRSLEKIIRLKDMVFDGMENLSRDEAIDLLIEIKVELSV